jgi:branched-chain amino acid transport system permease protein
MSFYASSLLLLLGINLIAVWGLDLQYGVTGIFNFAYIIFQAAGAYADGILALRPAAYYQGGETYVGGFHLPFPLPLLGAAVAGCLLAVPVSFIVRRLRGDYQAMALLVLSLIATAFVTDQTNFLDGSLGLSFIPKPLYGSVLPASPVSYQWYYFGFVAVLTVVVFFIVRAIVTSPFGRVLRGVRDSESALASLGRNAHRARYIIMMIGGALAGLSGGLFVQYITSWTPTGWLYPETFLFLTAIVVGGAANLGGNALGTVLVIILIQEATRFLPQIGYPGLIDNLDWVVIGLVLMVFLWFRPTGLLPERRRTLARFMPDQRATSGSLLVGSPGSTPTPVLVQTPDVPTSPRSQP